MLKVLSILKSYSKRSSTIEDLLSKEDFFLRDSMLGHKMASRSMFDVLSFRVTSYPNILSDLRCMDESECQAEFPDAELARCLDARLLELLERVRQEKAVDMADLEGLEVCTPLLFSVVFGRARRLTRDAQRALRAQDARHTRAVSALEDRIAHAQHALEAVSAQLAAEAAKRRTLEFAHGALAAKHTALLSSHHARSRSSSESADGLERELHETRRALAALHDVHSAASSAASVLERQGASLHVALNAMRAERDGLARALGEARADAERARREAEDARRDVRVLEERLRERAQMPAVDWAEDADEDEDEDGFACTQPRSMCEVNVLDVDLFEAQMERDLYRAQYEEEEAARVEVEMERDALREELRAAREENARLRAEKGEAKEKESRAAEEPRTTLTPVRERAQGTQDASVLEKKTASAHAHSANDDAKENEAPHNTGANTNANRHPHNTTANANASISHSHRFAEIFHDDLPSPSFSSELMFHSSPVLEKSGPAHESLSMQELQDLLASVSLPSLYLNIDVQDH